MRASASVTLTFTALGPGGQEIPVDDDGNPIITISIDTPEGNSGAYGSKIKFNVYIDPSNTIYQLDNSASDVGGVIFPETDGTTTGETTVKFTASNTANLPFPIEKMTGHEWIGNNLGSVSIIGNKVQCSKVGISNLKIFYERKYYGHSIMVPEQSADSFPVDVVAYVE